MLTDVYTFMHRLKARGRIDAWLLAAFCALALFLTLAFSLGSEVLEGETLAFDRSMLLALRNASDLAMPAGPRWLLPTMVDITALGGVSVLTLVTIVAVGFLFASRRPMMALFLATAVGGGATASTILKSIFGRARPDIVPHLVEVTSASFPSGHAMNSAIVYLTLGALLARSFNDGVVRTYLVALSILLTVTIGFSRVYLGVHWPTDVLAGWSFGAAWAIICSIAAQMLQRRAAIEPEGSATSTGDVDVAAPVRTGRNRDP